MFNPGHTEKGLEQLKLLVPSILNLRRKYDIRLVLIAYGRRYIEMYNALCEALNDVPFHTDRDFGTKDAAMNIGRGLKVIATEKGLYDLKSYQRHTDTVDAWAVLQKYPEFSLVCCGKPFLRALGKEAFVNSLYVANTVTRKVRLIYSGLAKVNRM